MAVHLYGVYARCKLLYTSHVPCCYYGLSKQHLFHRGHCVSIYRSMVEWSFLTYGNVPGNYLKEWHTFMTTRLYTETSREPTSYETLRVTSSLQTLDVQKHWRCIIGYILAEWGCKTSKVKTFKSDIWTGSLYND